MNLGKETPLLNLPGAKGRALSIAASILGDRQKRRRMLVISCMSVMMLSYLAGSVPTLVFSGPGASEGSVDAVLYREDLTSSILDEAELTVKLSEERIADLEDYCRNTDFPERKRNDTLYGIPNVHFSVHVVAPPPVTVREAVRLMCLHTVLCKDLDGEAFPESRTREGYLSWLGEPSGGSAMTWEGTFLPQKELAENQASFAAGEPMPHEGEGVMDILYGIDAGDVSRDVETETVDTGRTDENGDPVCEVHRYVTYTYAISSSPVSDVEERAGLWSGLRDDSARWISKSGLECSYPSSFDREYYDDLCSMTLENLGFDYEAGGIGEGIVGIACSEFLLHEENVKLCGGEKYWSVGYSTQVNWCACFVYWCAGQLGLTGEDMPFGKYTGSVRASWKHFDDLGRTVRVDETALFGSELFVPQPGDLVYFCDRKGNTFAHMGIVESYDPLTNTLITIEGNTSPSRLKGDYRSGEDHVVWEKDRTGKNRYNSSYMTYGIYGFARPEYAADGY